MRATKTTTVCRDSDKLGNSPICRNCDKNCDKLGKSPMCRRDDDKVYYYVIYIPLSLSLRSFRQLITSRHNDGLALKGQTHIVSTT
jgi:hypothetical protein